MTKAMVFLVDMYGCESWTIRKAEHQKIDAFKLWFWGEESRWRRNRMEGDHFLFYKFIERTTER